MTDPVDTDALRKMLWRNGRRATVVTLDSDLIESAADEVDRLRGRLHQVEGETVPEAIRMWQKEHDVAARLRAVIENAPHGIDCPDRFTWRDDATLPCDCWKAELV